MYLREDRLHRRGIIRANVVGTHKGRMEGKQGCRKLRCEAGCLDSLCGNESHKRILKGKVTRSVLATVLTALRQHARLLRIWVRDTKA